MGKGKTGHCSLLVVDITQKPACEYDFYAINVSFITCASWCTDLVHWCSCIRSRAMKGSTLDLLGTKVLFIFRNHVQVWQT